MIQSTQKQSHSLVSIPVFLEKQRYVDNSIPVFLEKQRHVDNNIPVFLEKQRHVDNNKPVFLEKQRYADNTLCYLFQNLRCYNIRSGGEAISHGEGFEAMFADGMFFNYM